MGSRAGQVDCLRRHLRTSYLVGPPPAIVAMSGKSSPYLRMNARSMLSFQAHSHAPCLNKPKHKCQVEMCEWGLEEAEKMQQSKVLCVQD